MSIWQRAVETYDCHSSLAGVYEIGKVPLAPISHMVKDADIEITLDQKGNFVDAVILQKSKNDSELALKTIIPVTENSAGRSGKKAYEHPHPLSDNLGNIIKCFPESYSKYIEQINEWVNSEFTHPKVRAVSTYIHNGTIIDDLLNCGIIETQVSGIPLEKYQKFLVRWRVLGSGNNDECYKDESLFEAFSNYYMRKKSYAPSAICMISGKYDYITSNAPKGVIASKFNAKLISTNNKAYFTYRGRFTNSQQAATIGYETSQKAHNALAWVAANQGIIIGGRTFVCWNPKGDASLFKDSGTLAPNYSDKEEEKDFPVTPTDYKADLKKALSGWQDKLPAEDDIVIASFDAATTGRLSITYYNELKGSDFLNRLAFWKEHCYWSSGKFGYQSPSIWEIVKCAFGTEQNGKLSVDDRVMREQAQRLFHCVIDQAPIPQDIVTSLTRKASAPLAYDDSKTHNHKKVLFTACAVIYAYRTVTKKEEWKMALEKNKKDRSYQFGRLLAVMEKVERDTYDRDEKREPNAIMLQSAFYERPFHTVYTIDGRLEPYFSKLSDISPAKECYYKNLIGEIVEQLSNFDSKDLNRRLEDSYLLGYYLQRNELYAKKENNNEEEN